MTRPRIAYLLKKFPRLSETFILNELLGLEAQGLELAVLSRRPSDDEPRHPELARLRAEVEVLPGSRELDPWSPLFGADEALSAALMERLPGVVSAFRRFEHPRMPSLLAEAIHLLGRTRELELAHLHVHFATDAAVVACLLHELGGPSYSITLHAKDIYRDTVDPALLDRLVAGSAFSVTVCDANVRHIHALVGERARGRLRRHYNGIDVGALSVGVGAPRDADHVLAVGRLVAKKGFADLISAAAELRRTRPATRFTIVGDGEDHDALLAQVRALGLDDVITFLGPRDQGEVRALLFRATCMALPCVVGDDGNRDALPTVLLEALAAGLPVVSTPVTGVPEIVDHGRAGVLVPERDPPALARALAALLDDAGRRADLALVGRARAEELFDMDRNATVLHEWLRSTLRADVAASGRSC